MPLASDANILLGTGRVVSQRVPRVMTTDAGLASALICRAESALALLGPVALHDVERRHTIIAVAARVTIEEGHAISTQKDERRLPNTIACREPNALRLVKQCQHTIIIHAKRRGGGQRGLFEYRHLAHQPRSKAHKYDALDSVRSCWNRLEQFIPEPSQRLDGMLIIANDQLPHLKDLLSMMVEFRTSDPSRSKLGDVDLALEALLHLQTSRVNKLPKVGKQADAIRHLLLK